MLHRVGLGLSCNTFSNSDSKAWISPWLSTIVFLLDLPRPHQAIWPRMEEGKQKAGAVSGLNNIVAIVFALAAVLKDHHCILISQGLKRDKHNLLLTR